MAAISFDPFRAQAHHAWRNRWARLRREPAQTATHAAALLALAMLLGVPAWRARASWGGALADVLEQWPVLIWIVVVAAMTWSCTATWRALRAAAQRDWLAALPVAASRRRRRVRDALLREMAGFAVLGGALLLAAGAGARAFVLLGAAMMAALVLAACFAWVASKRTDRRGAGARVPRIGVVSPHAATSHAVASRAATSEAVASEALVSEAVASEASDARGERLRHSSGSLAPIASRDVRGASGSVRRDAWSSVIADRGAGRLWRWQRLGCGVALHGRTLAWGALAWLTVPMGGGVGAALVVGVAGISLALLIGAWRRTLAVLPQAQRWLAPQPLTPSRLLRATWAVPVAVLAFAIAALAGVLLALGAPGLALFAALAVFAFGALQFAATAAERRHPARIALAFLVHAVLLIGVLQAFPIAAVPLWVVQMILLLRRALR